MKSSIASLALLATAPAFGVDPQARWPNNTGTALAAVEAPDPALQIAAAWLFKHLYGQDLVIELRVADCSLEKDIWVETENAGWAQAPFTDDWGNHRRSAHWQGKDDQGRDIIVVHAKGLNFPGQLVRVHVTMDGARHQASMRVGP